MKTKEALSVLVIIIVVFLLLPTKVNYSTNTCLVSPSTAKLVTNCPNEAVLPSTPANYMTAAAFYKQNRNSNPDLYVGISHDNVARNLIIAAVVGALSGVLIVKSMASPKVKATRAKKPVAKKLVKKTTKSKKTKK